VYFYQELEHITHHGSHSSVLHFEADMATHEKRKAERVEFSHRFEAQIMGIDGTWRRACTIEDVSKSGARLTVEDSFEGLNLKEFFLLLSTTGLAYRRCELAWVNGEQLGVRFLTQAETKKTGRKPQRADA
jgi:hypothetical protein